MLLPNFSLIGPAVWPEKSKEETEGRTDSHMDGWAVHDENTFSEVAFPDKLKNNNLPLA